MAVADRIQKYVEQLPERFQAEVLDYVQFLLSKVQRETLGQDRADWTVFSVENAMRGMEDEEASYSENDIKGK